MTIYDLLKSSLRAIGVLKPGRTPGQSETDDAVVVLNAMLRSWAAESLNVYAKTRREFAIAGGASSYTVGPAGDLAISERPVAIDAAATLEDGKETPIDVFQHVASASRVGLYYAASWPLGVLTPCPAWDAAQTLVLYTRDVFAEIEDLDAVVAFPAGYEDAIRYNLAVRLAPEWGVVAPAKVEDLARTSLAVIKTANLPKREIKIDSALFPA